MQKLKLFYLCLMMTLMSCTSTAAPPTAVPTVAPTAVSPTAEAVAKSVPLGIIWQDFPPCYALEKLSQDYPKATIKVTCLPISEWHDAIFNSFKPKTTIDLVVLDSQWIGEAVKGNHLAELTDWMAKNVEVNKYVPAAISSYGEYPYNSKRYYGVPLFSDTEMLVYRKDLLEQAGLQPPRTWQELLDHAKMLEQKKLIAHGYTTFWCGDGCYDDVQTSWNQIAWSYGGELWDPETYKIEGVLNTEANVEALKMAAELYKVGPGDSRSQAAVVDMMCKGEVGMISLWFGYGPAFTDPAKCPQAKNLAFGVVPAGPSRHLLSLGGQGIHLSAYSQYQPEALDFMAWLETRETQLKWVQLGSFSARTDVLSSDIFAKASPYSPAFAASYLLVKDFWNLPEYSELLPIQGHYLDLAITGKMDPTEALNEIAKQQQAILDKAYPDGPAK